MLLRVLQIIYDQPDIKMTSAKSHDENCNLALSLVWKKIHTFEFFLWHILILKGAILASAASAVALPVF